MIVLLFPKISNWSWLRGAKSTYQSGISFDSEGAASIDEAEDDEGRRHYTRFHNVKVTPLKGRVAQANSRFHSRVVTGFGNSALMYDITITGYVTNRPAVDIDCLRNNTNSNQCGDIDYSGYARKEGNRITGGNTHAGTVTLLDNNACRWESSGAANNSRPFEMTIIYTLEGTYTTSGSGSDFVIRCDTTDSSSIVYLSRTNDESTGSLAEYLVTDEKYRYIMFNEDAMKVIRSEWDESIRPQ